MKRKPRILLIPNVSWWIIGEMGKQIIARFGDEYDFYFVPEGVLERRPDLLRTLVASVDAVHCLNESSIELFRDADPSTLPPIATWIHHVTDWTAEHQFAIERSSAITVCTEDWKRYLAVRTPGKLPITVVPHGVDSAVFRRTEFAREKFGVPPNRFVVGFIGAKGSDADKGRKGTDVLLEVIRQSAAELPDLHVLLGGPGWDTVLTQLQGAGLSASASGYVSKAELPALYSALDTYLLTSRVEGGPCTVFEAMACETPVVATEVGAVPTLIQDGVNGFTAKIDDTEALVKAVVALGRDRQRARTMGKAARETAVRLPWGDVLSSLGPVYASLTQPGLTGHVAAPGPRWMSDPAALLRTSSAADALASVIGRVQRHSISVRQAFALLPDMLDRRSLVDVLRGAAMLRRFSYRAATPSRGTVHNSRPVVSQDAR